MKFPFPSRVFGMAGAIVMAAPSLKCADVPKVWVDPDTGHRIVRLSEEPGSASLYFNQNAFTPEGDKMVIATRAGIAAVDLKSGAVETVATAPLSSNLKVIETGRKSRLVYYTEKQGDSVVALATDVDTRATRRIGPVPKGGSLTAVNADESVLVGTLLETNSPDFDESAEDVLSARPGEGKGSWMVRRFQARVPMQLFTMNTDSGAVHRFHPSSDWLNHVQMSPTDPGLMLFCHEGPWHLVDRIWTVRTDGSELKSIHARTMEMEIAGHEFFSSDGHSIWYDLQTPRGEDFWLAGYDLSEGTRTRYHLQRDEWSVHYNVSPDGKLFAGDGGDSGMVAHARDGKWIYLLRPEPIHVPSGPPENASGLIHVGVFHAEHLVNMSRHNYRLEPNVRFTPDGKWVVFRSNLFGPTHVFKVEVAKEKP